MPVCIADENKYLELKNNLADTDIKVLGGNDGILECAKLSESDVVVNAIVGIADLDLRLRLFLQKRILHLQIMKPLLQAVNLLKKLFVRMA